MDKIQYISSDFLAPRDAWDKLPMSKKAEIMKVAISNGITNLSDIRREYNEFAMGGDKEDVVPYEQKMEVIITPDSEYNQYLNTLPDNQRFTPNDRYDSYLYWKLNDRPRDFKEAYKRGMFHYDHSDNGYHANSIAWGNDGIGYFMKPKDHDTVGYELDWFNKGLVTEEGGWQRPETFLEWKESQPFRGSYKLIDDPSRPNYYRYQPIEKAYGGNLFREGGSVVDDSLVDLIIKEEGFNTKPEDIGDGKITLGSGLTNSRWHDLYRKRGNVWSEADNRNAVRTEAAEREQWAKTNVPNWNSLPDSAKKALLLYKYNFDFTRGNSPKLFAALEAGNLQEAARQMDATSKDPKFRKGLADRRRREQALFLSEVPVTGVAPRDITIQSPVNTYIQNPYTIQQQNTVQLPQYVPAQDEYVRTVELSPEQQRAIQLKERFDQINKFNQIMKLVGIENTALPAFMPETGVTMLDAIWNNRNTKERKHEDGGPIVRMANIYEGTKNPTQQMQTSDYRYVLGSDGKWSMVDNDEMARVFQGFTATPKGNQQKFIPEKIDNSVEAATRRDKFLQNRNENGTLIGEPGLKSAYPEFDVIALSPLLRMAGEYAVNKIGTAAASYAAKYPAIYQYPRYAIGKFKYGFDAELPTLYRKIKGMPKIENGKVQISNLNNRFAYDNGYGEESPLITNMTSDAPVRSHGAGDWDRGLTLSFPGKTLLGKKVISTRPSDTFVFGENISIPIKDVKAFTGRPKEIRFLNEKGIEVTTSPDSQTFFESGVEDYLTKATKYRVDRQKVLQKKAEEGLVLLRSKRPVDNFSNYSREIEDLTREVHKAPTARDYAFMDYVFKPQYNSQTIPVVDDITMDAVNQYPLLGEWAGNVERLRYLGDFSRWRNVMYDPLTTAEADFRRSMNINLKPNFKK